MQNRITYAQKLYENFILPSWFNRDADAMECADWIRGEGLNWQIVDSGEYAQNTRDDLLGRAKQNIALKLFISYVIECCDYNRSMEST